MGVSQYDHSAAQKHLSTLSPSPLSSSLSLSLFLSSLGNKFETKVFSDQLKTGLEVVLREIKYGISTIMFRKECCLLWNIRIL